MEDTGVDYELLDALRAAQRAPEPTTTALLTEIKEMLAEVVFYHRLAFQSVLSAGASGMIERAYRC